MNKLITKIAGVALGLTMAVGVGTAVGVSKKEAVLAKATAGDEITYTITQSSVTNYPSSYSDTETTWSQNNDGGSISMSFALAQHMTNSTNMQSKASAGYFRNTTIPDGYAIKSIRVVNGSGTQRVWNLYGSDDVITASNYTSATSVASSTTAATAVSYGSGTTYDSAHYPHSFFFARRGSNAQYSSSYVIKLVELSPSTAKLTSVSVSGDLTQDEYTTAETWNNAGLVVTANYDDSSTKTVTGSATWSYSPATPSAGGAGTYDVRFTATYDGLSGYVDKQVIVTKAIEYELVTDPSKLTKGTTFLFVGNSTSTKAMQQDRTTSNAASGVADVTLSNGFNSGSIATSANATVFTLGGSAGAWTITNGNNQLGFTGTDNNNMKFNENQTDTFKITTQSGYLLSVESNAYSGRKLQYNHNNNSPRFSNYNGGQTYIYMFANIAEVSYGTTHHISISTIPQTEFASGETFSSKGLAITAWDGADETTANSKSVEVTSVSLTGTTFDDEDIGSQTVTVTYTESGANFTATYSIYVYAAATYELVTGEPSGGWAGSYLITSEVTTATTAIPTTGTYAMKSTLDNFDVVGNFAAVNPVAESGVTSIVAGQHLQFSIAAVTGGYSIQGHSGKYIGWSSSTSNGLTTSSSALVNTISIEGGDVTILCSAGTKGLTLNTSSGQFRYYSNATVKLYKLVESSEAADYAAEFLDLMSSGENPACKYNPETKVVTSDIEDLKVAWAILALDFDSLSNADKQLFTQGTADEHSSDNISKALALYDYVATKYSTRLQSEDCSNYNFMSRSITPLSIRGILFDETTTNSGTVAIIIVSLVSVTALGGYFFIKKKKHQ